MKYKKGLEISLSGIFIKRLAKPLLSVKTNPFPKLTLLKKIKSVTEFI